MGEAKRRGPLDARKQQAETRGDQFLRLFKDGKAPHYAFILDRSEDANTIIRALKSAPSEIRARFASPAFELWEQAGDVFPFVAVWGTFGYSGGMTIPTRSIETVLSETLPAVMARTLEKGGLCTFVVGVEPALRNIIEQRLAELQPMTEAASGLQ